MSDLPRVLLCSFDVLPGPTGFSRRMTEYLKGLCDRFTVVVLSTKTQDVSHIERYHGSRLLRVPVGTGDLPSKLQTFERAVRRQLESEEYALAHFTDPFGGYVLAELKEQYGYRAIYEADGFPSHEIKYAHPLLAGDRRMLAKIRRQELFCLMNADLVLTGSNVSRQFIESLGVPQEQLRVLRAPVDLGPYTARPMGEPDGAPMRIVYLGSQVGWQGLPTLLGAMKRALEQTELRLTLVGPSHPDWHSQLADLVNGLQLASRVEFHSPLAHDELYKVLAAADLGVVPLEDVERNRLQGGPLSKISEYLAAGRPVVASDLPVCRELLPEGTALFFKPGDAEDLADCLIELSNSPKLRVEMGRTARAEAIRHVDASVIRTRLLDIYDELMGRRGRPAAAETLTPTATGTPTRRVPERSDSPTLVDVHQTDPAILLPVGKSSPTQPPATELRTQDHDTDPRSSRPDTLPDGQQPAEEMRAPPDTDPEGRRPETELPTTFVDLDKLRDTISQAPAPRLPAPPWIKAPPASEPVPETRPSPPLEIPLPPPPEARMPVTPSRGTHLAPSSPSSLETLPASAGAPSLEAPAVPVAPAVEPASDQPEEIADDLVEPVEDEATPDEAQEIDPDEVVEAGDASTAPDEVLEAEEAAEAVEAEVAEPDVVEAEAMEVDAEEAGEELPPSRIDPWFAQLAHGYCPPEGLQFARHTPPTTFPGREDAPSRPRTGETPAVPPVQKA